MAALATIAAASLGTAIAVWLLPASVDIVSWSRTGVARVAVFAPLFQAWWALAAGIVAALAIAFAGRTDAAARARRAHRVAPLAFLWLWTLPFLPWLPDRIPLLLVLAGPLRWAIAIPAVLACLLRSLPFHVSWFWGQSERATAQQRKVVFAVTLALYLVLGFRSLGIIGLGGDEPHYLVITHSLLVDHDLKIENNHARGDYRAFFGGDLRPDYMQRGANGEIYSIHAPGLSALVLPAYAIAGARGAVAVICLLAALTALAVFDLALLAGGRRAAWATWASICLTVPFIPHAWAIYPEMAGAAIVAWAALWCAKSDESSALHWLWRGSVLAMLPWLHTKFVVILAALTLLLLVRTRTRVTRSAAFLAPIGASLALWFAFFHAIYGTFDPQAPYGDYATQFVHLENIPRSVLGTFFDQKFGLLMYAPIYAIAIIGAIQLLRDPRWRVFTLAAFATGLLFVLSSARLYMWWGGSSAPARFLVPVMPLAAPMLARAFRGPRTVSANAWVLLAISLAISAVSVLGFRELILFSEPHGFARIVEHVEGSAPLAAALPTFTDENWRSPLMRLLPWLAAFASAAAIAWYGFRRRRASMPLVLTIEAGALVLVAFALAGPFSAAAKARSVTNGRLAVMRAFDPVHLRAFDLARLAKMTPADLTDAAKLTFDLDPTQPADELGRLTGALSLPPGDYQTTVWFEGPASRAGDLLIALGRGQVLARLPGPLPNPTTIRFAIPIEVPQLWVQMTDRASAQTVTRVVVAPLTIVPARARAAVEPRAVEAAPPHSGAYIVYSNDWTYPEGGVFWTRGTARGEVLVVPAGAPRLLLTLHIGPTAGTVHLEVDGRSMEIAMKADETREVPIDVAASQPFVSLAVESSGAFRPADVDRASTDTRMLGCQVRIETR